MLSPMLFNIYMKLLSEVNRRLRICCHQYTNDIQLYLTLVADLREVVERLGCGLEKMVDWTRMNKLRHNSNKQKYCGRAGFKVVCCLKSS